MNDTARGRDIIEQILVNMRSQTEELRYSRIVSSFYNVHLHPDDFARLEGLVPEIVLQARRALGEELERLNRARPMEEQLRQWMHKPRVPYERAAPEWSVQILSDPNEELQPGDILVDAMLVTPGSDGLAGSMTQRIVTHRHGEQVERRVTVAEPAVLAVPVTAMAVPASAGPAPPTASSTARPQPPAPASDSEPRANDDTRPALATLRWRDERGEHAFRMATPSIKVGRGGASYWVDVKLDASADVSREHLRIRYDEAARRFYIQDLSTFGTAVGGQPLPKAAPDSPPGAGPPESPLPDRASITLADVLVMMFEAEPQVLARPEAGS